MKTKLYISFWALLSILLVSSCTDDFLERPPLDTIEDNPEFWNSETNVRSHVVDLYKVYFPGYKSSWERSDFFEGTNESEWTDDLAQESATFFTQNPPTTADETSGWYLNYLRRINLIVERMGTSGMETTAREHWVGVGRFLRAMEYAKLVSKFGDMPWYDRVINPEETDLLYAKRESRTFIMDKVLEDLTYAANYVRIDDGVKGLRINRDVVKAFASRIMLFEGTWQKYRENNTEYAKKYLQAAQTFANDIIISGKYSIAPSYKQLTISLDLANNPEIIMYRSYVAGLVTHAEMSWQNELPEKSSPSKDLVDSYLSSNGLHIHQAENTLYKGDKWISDEMQHRDPRLYDNVDTTSLFLDGVEAIYAAAGYFGIRFVSNDLKNTAAGSSNTNTTDAPVMRYGEVLLNYIEASAELAQLGAYTLSQEDFNKTINELHNRTSVKMPEVKLVGDKLTNDSGIEIKDPNRDADVPQLIWEIRRERRVEMVYEGLRFNDLRRWNKLHYADMVKNPKLNLGAWLDKEAFVKWYNEKNNTSITLEDLSGVKLDRAGNAGYIQPIQSTAMLREYGEKDYLYPIPVDQITLYQNQGKELKQNPHW